jgi:CheY-like chemotaxis protein
MHKFKVLIVDNDVALQGRPLEKWVVDAGYESVGIAKSQKMAVQLHRQHQPDIVLLDIHLGMSDPEGGIEAGKLIHAERPGTKIIYVTGVPAKRDLMEKVAATNPVGFVKKALRQKDVLANLELAVALLQNKQLVFVCYSHQNADMMLELQEYLKQLHHAGVEPWVDTRIKAGEDWKQEISLALQRARAAVVLVSIELMNSVFIKDVELPSLLDAARRTQVIPVFVNAVPLAVLEKSGLLKFRGINPPTSPLDGWSNAKRRSDAWVPLFNRLAENGG